MAKKPWTRRQQTDPFVKRAREEGWRARSAFKLMELDDSEQLLSKARMIVDLGAAPGGWCQVARARAPRDAAVFALDLLDMAPIDGVTFIQGDFRESPVLNQLEEALNEVDGRRKVDLVLSDMAPNISGIGPSDQARSLYLAELALDFAKEWLELGGCFVVKVFQGEGFDTFLTEVRGLFKTVKIKKPKSSRSESREVYLVAKGLRAGA